MEVESNVKERYSQGALERQEALCCPVDYDANLLKILPEEIIEKDYGCGDPSRYVQTDDIVLDLGSGGGKICYMAAQLVGEKGRVIGVDMTDEMLSLARKYQGQMAQTIGSDRVEFKKGYIQDLSLDLRALEDYIAEQPIDSLQGWQAFEQWRTQQRQESPMIADNSVTLVISNCVLNLVAKSARQQMIEEIFRVLKPGGRVAISDIVCDEQVPARLQNDPQLWSGCISGAFEEQAFLQAFIDAGFKAVAYDKWDDQPWQVVEDIEFRSVTLIAIKPESAEHLDCGQAAIYKGPYSKVSDDDGNSFMRGVRTAVSDRSFRQLNQQPYREDFVTIQPATEVCGAQPFTSCPGTSRPVAQTKGGSQRGGGGSGCC